MSSSTADMKYEHDSVGLLNNSTTSTSVDIAPPHCRTMSRRESQLSSSLSSGELDEGFQKLGDAAKQDSACAQVTSLEPTLTPTTFLPMQDSLTVVTSSIAVVTPHPASGGQVHPQFHSPIAVPVTPVVAMAKFPGPAQGVTSRSENTLAKPRTPPPASSSGSSLTGFGLGAVWLLLGVVMASVGSHAAADPGIAACNLPVAGWARGLSAISFVSTAVLAAFGLIKGVRSSPQKKASNGYLTAPVVTFLGLSCVLSTITAFGSLVATNADQSLAGCNRDGYYKALAMIMIGFSVITLCASAVTVGTCVLNIGSSKALISESAAVHKALKITRVQPTSAPTKHATPKQVTARPQPAITLQQERASAYGMGAPNVAVGQGHLPGPLNDISTPTSPSSVKTRGKRSRTPTSFGAGAPSVAVGQGSLIGPLNPHAAKAFTRPATQPTTGKPSGYGEGAPNTPLGGGSLIGPLNPHTSSKATPGAVRRVSVTAGLTKAANEVVTSATHYSFQTIKHAAASMAHALRIGTSDPVANYEPVGKTPRDIVANDMDTEGAGTPSADDVVLDLNSSDEPSKVLSSASMRVAHLDLEHRNGEPVLKKSSSQLLAEAMLEPQHLPEFDANNALLSRAENVH